MSTVELAKTTHDAHKNVGFFHKGGLRSEVDWAMAKREALVFLCSEVGRHAGFSVQSFHCMSNKLAMHKNSSSICILYDRAYEIDEISTVCCISLCLPHR